MSGSTTPASPSSRRGDVVATVENTLYTAVGLGILGFQHLQVQRRELTRKLSATARQVADQVGCTVNRPG